MSDDSKCFYEEIGASFAGKLWECGCGDENVGDQLPKFCPFCGKEIEVAPGCRRCGSTEHTTGYHDGLNSGAQTEPAVEIKAISGDEFMRLIIDNAQENDS